MCTSNGRRIIDSSLIIGLSRKGKLRDEFLRLFQDKILLYITDEVLKEIKNKLNADQRIVFDITYNEGVKRKLIVSSHNKYKLKRKFKELKQALLSSKEDHLSRPDAILIALAGQVGAYVDTTDTGIIHALSKLKCSKNPWQKYFLDYDLEIRKKDQQLDFDQNYDDGE